MGRESKSSDADGGAPSISLSLDLVVEGIEWLYGEREREEEGTFREFVGLLMNPPNRVSLSYFDALELLDRR